MSLKIWTDPIAEVSTTLDRVTLDRFTLDRFPRFPRLPTELRLFIWKEALFEASSDRYILLYRNRVVPFRRFISPLLLANRESRGCATAFYHVKINVHAVTEYPHVGPEPSFLTMKEHRERVIGSNEVVDGVIENYLIENAAWGYKHTRVDLEQHWSKYVGWVLSLHAKRFVDEVKDSDPTTGAFYINPEHDLFLCGYDCGSSFCTDMKMALLEQDHPGPNDISCRHISAVLSAAICQQVNKSVYVRPPQFPVDCIFDTEGTIWVTWISDCMDSRGAGEWQVHKFWNTTAFPNLCAYYMLELNRPEEYLCFLARLTDPSKIGQPLQLRKWIWQERDGNKRVLVDVGNQ